MTLKRYLEIRNRYATVQSRALTCDSWLARANFPRFKPLFKPSPYRGSSYSEALMRESFIRDFAQFIRGTIESIDDYSFVSFQDVLIEANFRSLSTGLRIREKEIFRLAIFKLERRNMLF